MGSKARIAKDIVQIIHYYMFGIKVNAYIEPFCGGCNIIDKINHTCRIASDTNKYLIALLEYVRDDGKLPDNVSREEYIKVKQNLDMYPDWYVGAVGFLASYNGRFLDGGYAKPGYEVVKGVEKYRDYYKEAKENLLEQSKYIKNIKFKACDYRNYNGVKGALIYCDPPYEKTQGYSDNGKFDSKDFWRTMRLWSMDNIVIISELWGPSDFECIYEVDVKRTLGVEKKENATEKLFKLRQDDNAEKLFIF